MMRPITLFLLVAFAFISILATPVPSPASGTSQGVIREGVVLVPEGFFLNGMALMLYRQWKLQRDAEVEENRRERRSMVADGEIVDAQEYQEFEKFEISAFEHLDDFRAGKSVSPEVAEFLKAYEEFNAASAA